MMRPMRIGGFVIHGNDRATLGDCLDSLLSVCDEVITIDSCSTDGSAELVRSKGIRSKVVPWQGYGAARQEAVKELAGFDYVFFLDSDEVLSPDAVAAFQRWRASKPTLPHYAFIRHDWAHLPTGSFVFRSEWQTRLVRYDAAVWRPEMIVHEALPPAERGKLTPIIEHRFLTSVDILVEKQDWYALLWGIQAHAEGKRAGSLFLKRPAHVFRNCVAKGGLLRGGLESVRVAWAVSRYHAFKHDYLRRISAGEFPEFVAAYREKRWLDLFAMRHLPRGGGAPAPPPAQAGGEAQPAS